MAWIDDLYRQLGVHSGSWNIFGIPLPDLGITEANAQMLSGDVNQTDLSDAISSFPNNNSNSVPFSSGPAGGGGGGGGGGAADDPRYQELMKLKTKGDLNPAQADELKNLENANNGGSSSTILDMLRRDRDRKLSELDNAYNMAKSYGSDAMNALTKRREGFEEDRTNTESDIFNQFGADRANLQTSAEGQDARTTRGLLAQGIGGSGLAEALRRNESSRQQNYGTLREGRRTDERTNETNFNERSRWADEQEASVNRYLEQALMQRNQGRGTTLDNYANTIGSLISQAQAAAQALAQSGSNIGTTEIAGIPLAGLSNGSFLNDLQAAYQLATGANNQTDNINPTLANLSLTDEDLRRRGLLN